MKPKIRVSDIHITRAEGPHDLCGTWKRCTWFAANERLKLNAETAPKGGAYDKHDVRVIFSDGYTYDARIDMHHPSYGPAERIEDHIKFHVRFYGGLLSDAELPSHISPARYREILPSLSTQAERDGIIEFLNTYQLGD